MSTLIESKSLTDGLLYQHFHPHIHAFTFTDSIRETIDAGYDKIIELDTYHAQNGLHIQYLYVLDHITLTSYMALKLQKATALTLAELTESIAIVADTFLAAVIDRLMMPLINQEAQSVTRFFTTEQEAFAWFEQRREEIGY
ncbi:MAG: hypothetical protein AAF846_15570 [Chloroflexota bacterium]